MKLVSALLTLALFGIAPSAVASPQADREAQQPASATEQAAPASGTAYAIGPDDLLTITVFGEQDLTNKYRVDTDGRVTFPLVGRVPASGLTIREFQDQLTARLAAGYIKNPQVRVEVEQYKSQSVFVIGEVRAPGKITMTGSMSLIEALALAGSPTSAASSELIVVHPKKPSPARAITMPDENAETTKINIRDLQVGKAGQDVVLRDGDTIFVPKAQTFYITGQVKNPGSYVLEPGMTVLQAISVAGGLGDRGSDRGIKIERILNGKRVVVEVKLTDIVLANDTIQIRARFF